MGPSTFDLAARRAALTPERPAVWFEGRWFTYGELDERATRLATFLQGRGVTKGDRVSILAPNHLLHLELMLATPKLGFVYAPLNYRLTAAEQRAVLELLEPKVVFFDPELETLPHFEDTQVLELGEVAALEEGATALEPPPLQADDAQLILLTGGTTGIPKGAVQPYRQGFFNAVNTVFSWGLRDDDRAVQATPCFHAAVNALSLPLLYLGGQVVLQRRFDPGAYLRLVQETGCTLLFMVPTMFQLLTEHPDFAAADLSRVRWAISGGAPCPQPVRAAFAAKGVHFRQGYGLTEAGVNCFACELDAADARPTTVGKPVLYSEAVIRDAIGVPVRAGEVGELTLRGPHLFSHYFRRPEATQEVVRDGWLYTGDLAQKDEDGFFYLVGRHKEMFISGGENVYPTEIERALYEHEAVAECAVLGVPDARWGEVGLAAVVLKKDAQVGEAELLAFLKARLAPYKVPKHLQLQEALPKNAAGKVLKRNLTELGGATHAAS